MNKKTNHISYYPNSFIEHVAKPSIPFMKSDEYWYLEKLIQVVIQLQEHIRTLTLQPQLWLLLFFKTLNEGFSHEMFINKSIMQQIPFKF